MKRIYFFLCVFAIFLILPFSFTAAAERGKFRDIPFGTSYSEVLKKLNEQKNKIHTIKEQKDSISIDNFSLGEMKLTVFLLFDHNKKFYSFQFHTQPYPAVLFDEVKRQAEELNAIFKSKYGATNECFKDPALSKIHDGEIFLLCDWGMNQFDIHVFTGYTAGRNLCLPEYNTCYHVIGIVISEKMLNDLSEHLNKKEKKKAAEAAKEF